MVVVKYYSRILYGISALCFLAALYFPSFSTDTGSSDGFALLITGGFGFFVDSGASFSLLANPFYIASLIVID